MRLRTNERHRLSSAVSPSSPPLAPFVTLLFALAALSTKDQPTFELPADARTWLSRALVLFFLAAVAALLTNVPLRYQTAEPVDIRNAVESKPTPSQDEAEMDLALVRVAVLTSARTKNTLKGWILVVAMALEVLALGCVARAMSSII